MVIIRFQVPLITRTLMLPVNYRYINLLYDLL